MKMEFIRNGVTITLDNVHSEYATKADGVRVIRKVWRETGHTQCYYTEDTATTPLITLRGAGVSAPWQDEKTDKIGIFINKTAKRVETLVERASEDFKEATEDAMDLTRDILDVTSDLVKSCVVNVETTVQKEVDEVKEVIEKVFNKLTTTTSSTSTCGTDDGQDSSPFRFSSLPEHKLVAIGDMRLSEGIQEVECEWLYGNSDVSLTSWEPLSVVRTKYSDHADLVKHIETDKQSVEGYVFINSAPHQGAVRCLWSKDGVDYVSIEMTESVSGFVTRKHASEETCEALMKRLDDAVSLKTLLAGGSDSNSTSVSSGHYRKLHSASSAVSDDRSEVFRGCSDRECKRAVSFEGDE